MRFELYINQGRIPYAPNPVFLEITFDEFLNFRFHTEGLAIRARKRLNIIKIFSHKSWNLSHETLKGIYMKIPKIIREIKILGKKRVFVKINEKGSEKFSIECGLPLALEKSKSYSVLFADDLGALYIRTNTWKALENKITVYLNKLTEWLYKWRLKMNTSKCIFCRFLAFFSIKKTL